MGYRSEEFKKSIVQKFYNRGARSVADIAKEAGVSTASVYQWSLRYATGLEMTNLDRRPQDWSAADKFRAVMEFDRLEGDEQAQGEYLRRAGLHSEHIASWKECMRKGLVAGEDAGSPAARGEFTELRARNKELEKDLLRKDRALAETTALLVLKKKADLIWGTGEDE